MDSVQVDGSGTTFVIGAEQTLFLAFQRFGLSTYDVSAVGKRFLVNSFGSETSNSMSLMVNWTADLNVR